MASASNLKTTILNSRNLAIALAGLTVILAGVAGGLWYWTTSPQYALGLIRSAAGSRDWEQFQHHVDIDSLTASAADQILQYSRNNSCREKFGDLITGLLKTSRPALAEALKNRLRAAVETGSPQQPPAGAAPPSPPFAATLLLERLSGGNTAELKNMEYVKTDSRQAIAAVKIYYPKLKADAILQLSLQNRDGCWQLTGIANLEDYLARLSSLEIARLDRQSRPVTEKINSLLAVSTLSTAKIFGDTGGACESLYFRFKIKNSAQLAITQLDGEILVFDRKTGQLMLDWSVRSGKLALGPGLTETLVWTRTFCKNLPGDLALLSVPYDNLITKFKIERVIFADGSRLEMATTLP